ncbi:MAG: DUF2920 family protein [Clostridia bacterium]|nr:DUF2920 family protein [Clostridia bacterium]
MEIKVTSTIDGSNEPSLFYEARKKNMPLLVVLHTWSFDRFNQIDDFLPYQKKLGWNMLFPEFRGPNLASNTRAQQACGSQLAKQDIADAIFHVIKNYHIDQTNIFLVGSSGGGHMALLMAGFMPMLFKKIIANCSVTDIRRWWSENPGYQNGIEACTGGAPDAVPPDEYSRRSPVYYIDTIAKSNLLMLHGKFDQSVPCEHSMDLFREIHKRYPDSKVFISITDMAHEWIIEDVICELIRLVKKDTTASNDSVCVLTK